MCEMFVLALALAVSASSDEPTFPLRTDPRPTTWKIDEINDGLPYSWETGTVHVLAWETTEDDRKSRTTQVLVLKKFDQPTEKGGYRWVLARRYHHPEEKDWPWKPDFWHIPFARRGEKMPKMTDAQVFGHEFYNDAPTEKHMEAFLRETGWRPTLGPWEAFTLSDDGKKVVTVTHTTRLAAGGVDRTLWKSLFGRDVPADLFPELKKFTDDKK